MFLQVSIWCASLLIFWAGKWLVSCVDPFKLNWTTILVKCLVTHISLVTFLLYLFCYVSSNGLSGQIPCQILNWENSFFSLSVLKGLSPIQVISCVIKLPISVNAHLHLMSTFMCLQITTLCEFPVTFHAVKWPPSSVNPFMILLFWTLFKCFITFSKGNGFSTLIVLSCV